MGKKSKSNSTSGSKPEATPARPSAVADPASGQDDQRSTLERRRDALQERAGVAEAADLECTRLEQDLENNSLATRQQESAMEAATARVSDLEQALKTSGKQRKETAAALKQARSGAKQAHAEAAAAEQKYEKAVLKEVVRREKVVDLTVHPSRR